jgi:AcrR family transcriptional regulator
MPKTAAPSSEPPARDLRGREQVTRALLDAAAELFAARGTAGVSVRDIAAHAGVNHGLVHRHFGSKSALRRAVMEHLTRDLARTAERMGTPSFGLSADALALPALDRYWRLLARAILDGDDLAEVQQGFPVIDLILERARAAHEDGTLRPELDPRLLTALATALALGWLLFEPFVLAATGLTSHSRTRVRKQAFAMWLTLITR